MIAHCDVTGITSVAQIREQCRETQGRSRDILESESEWLGAFRDSKYIIELVGLPDLEARFGQSGCLLNFDWGI